MKTNNKLLYIIIPIVNSLLFFVIPDYFFWFAVVLFIGAFICLAIVAIDILDKTNNWKDALKILGIGAASYIVGILLIILRNYFLGYYSSFAAHCDGLHFTGGIYRFDESVSIGFQFLTNHKPSNIAYYLVFLYLPHAKTNPANPDPYEPDAHFGTCTRHHLVQSQVEDDPG
ncbi:hypothetical protein [Puia sp.]|jgi:hypothetical protein|uniref:hypothetical protein n=1 Tax=Puia sp. TaxID=2045100 RepID=UPI002F40E9E3